MSEANIQSGIKTALQAMTEFEDADIVVNDWGILDQSSLSAPYVIIEDADDFTSDQDTETPKNLWSMPITLIERFTDWTTTLNNLRTRRQAIIDKINSGTVRSAGGLAGTNLRRVRNDGPIGRIYPAYIPEGQAQDALPAFLSQRIILEVEAF